jgi:hypothetical protein
MPETTPYLLLGLTVVFTILIVYSGSLVLRFNNAYKDAQLLEQLKDE